MADSGDAAATSAAATQGDVQARFMQLRGRTESVESETALDPASKAGASAAAPTVEQSDAQASIAQAIAAEARMRLMVDETNKSILAASLPDSDSARLESELEQYRLEGEKQHANELVEAQSRVSQLEAQLVKVKAAIKAHLMKKAAQTANERELRAKRLERLHNDLGQTTLKLQSTAKVVESVQAENLRLKQQLDACNAELARKSDMVEETRAEAQAAVRAQIKADAKVPEASVPTPAPLSAGADLQPVGSTAPASSKVRRLVREGKDHVSKLLALHRASVSGEGRGRAGEHEQLAGVALPLVDWYVRLHELVDPPKHHEAEADESNSSSTASATATSLPAQPATVIASDSTPPPAAAAAATATATTTTSATMTSPLVKQALAAAKPGQLPSYISTTKPPSMGTSPVQPAAKATALSALDADYEAAVASLDDMGEEEDMDALMGGMA